MSCQRGVCTGGLTGRLVGCLLEVGVCSAGLSIQREGVSAGGSAQGVQPHLVNERTSVRYATCWIV